MENRAEQTYTHRFKVWDAMLLRQAHEPVAAKTYSWRDIDPSHTIHNKDAKFVTFEEVMINIISLLKGFGSSNSSLLLRYQVLPHLKSLADMVSQRGLFRDQ